MRDLLWVAGGRDYENKDVIRQTLYPFVLEDHWELVTGAARGADLLAEEYWRSKMRPYRGIPADWDTYGKPAGYRRNEYIAYNLKPEMLIAFPGGRGTGLAIDLAVRRKINLVMVEKTDFICKTCRECDSLGLIHPGQLHNPGICDCECRD